MRPGQRGAIQTIWATIRANEKRTATIVLPTRYGKSDVIRASAIGLMADNLVSRAVILEPASNLVTQILNKAKMELAVQRYNLPFGHRIATFPVRDTPRLPFPPRFAREAHFLAMTTQMANLNRTFFAEWIQHEIAEHDCPPIWFVDECHTGSRDNEWGRTVRALLEAGAYMVLLTATPFRTDRSHVEGFEYDEVARDSITARVGDELWTAEHIRYELRADWSTTFQEAWNERPQSLCYLARIPIDKPVQRYATLSGTRRDDSLLSDLGFADAQRLLPSLTRDRGFVNDAVEQFVEVLRNRQLAFEETAGMVYVGNDSPDDEEANAHANLVSEIIHEHDPDLDVVIATSSTEDAKAALEAFQNGQGDVLVVKQMGGVGMDVERLKVSLDLSTVRTLQAFIQRVCRIATMWSPTDDPDDVVRTATYITPADALGLRQWEEFVQQQGGSAEERVTLEYLGALDPGGAREQPPLPDTFVPAEGASIGEMVDTEQRRAPGEQLSAVQRLTSIFPELSKAHTEPELANILTEHGIVIDGQDGQAPSEPAEPTPPAPPAPDVVDLYAEQKAARSRANTLARRVVRQRQGPGVVDEHFGEIIKRVFVDHKRKCGLPLGRDLKDLDVPQLNRLAESLLGELNDGE